MSSYTLRFPLSVFDGVMGPRKSGWFEVDARVPGISGLLARPEPNDNCKKAHNELVRKYANN